MWWDQKHNFILKDGLGTSSLYVVKPEAAATPAPLTTTLPEEAKPEAAAAAAPPTEPPPVSDKISEEPAPAEAPTSENVAPDAEKPVEPDRLPQPSNVEVTDQVNASPLETSRTMSEVRFSEMNDVCSASTASFTSDVSDTMSMERC